MIWISKQCISKKYFQNNCRHIPLNTSQTPLLNRPIPEQKIKIIYVNTFKRKTMKQSGFKSFEEDFTVLKISNFIVKKQ